MLAQNSLVFITSEKVVNVFFRDTLRTDRKISLLESVKSHPAAVVEWWNTQRKPHYSHFNGPLTTEWRRKLPNYSADMVVNISFKYLQLNKTRRGFSVPLEFHQV